MKVLLYDETPAYFCPGGKQALAQKLFESLKALDVDVEYARWWDPSQKCDLLHMFGYSPAMVNMAHHAGAKVVITHIVDGMTNSAPAKQAYHRVRNNIMRVLPGGMVKLFDWHILPKMDALVYIHQYDAATAIKLYRVPTERCHIIPHGCDEAQIVQLKAGARNAQSYLVSMGSIVPRKNSVLLAQAAKLAKVPVMFLGQPFNKEDAYFKEFLALVDGQYVIYPGYVSEEEKTKILTDASGFALLSKGESGCIAVYEAAAACLPLFLSDLPWAYGYEDLCNVSHVSISNMKTLAFELEKFYANSKRLTSQSFKVDSWIFIAQQYSDMYKHILDNNNCSAN
jgi:glycosyltransferase involved in cell wall biosynthesis